MAEDSGGRRRSDLPWIGVFAALFAFLIYALATGAKL